jgi:hypothetical protein
MAGVAVVTVRGVIDQADEISAAADSALDKLADKTARSASTRTP